MLADQFRVAVTGARNSHALDETARLLWRAHGEGQITDADAEAVSDALQARRAAFARPVAVALSKTVSGLPKPAKRQRSPDRQASLERRRRQAMSGVVPARIAASFTPGELAVLSVIGRTVQRCGGVCVLPIDALAALAGVSRTTTQNALRAARRLGLIEVRERRRRGLPSRTNVIKIISAEWSSWLKLGGQGIGFKLLSTTNSPYIPRGRSEEKQYGTRGEQGWPLSTPDNSPIMTARGRGQAAIEG